MIGWGTKRQVWQVSAGTLAVMTYRYVHLMWVFWLAHNIVYQWAIDTPQGRTVRPITPEEMTQYGVSEHLKINWWLHYSLLALIGVLVIVPLLLTVLGLAGVFG